MTEILTEEGVNRKEDMSGTYPWSNDNAKKSKRFPADCNLFTDLTTINLEKRTSYQ